MAIIKTMKITIVGESIEKLEPSHIAGTIVQMLQKVVLCLPENLPYDPAIPLLDTYPKALKSRHSNKYLFMNVYVRFLVNTPLDDKDFLTLQCYENNTHLVQAVPGDFNLDLF